MSVPEHLKSQVDNLPDKPGIYKFFDVRDKIIYIGKAKSLNKRVRSYFTGTHDSGRLRLLVAKINRIEHTLVDNEFDAFLLENSLIKKHQPRYNVNLKDSKTYPFICIKNERFPRVFPTRQFIRDGSEYFGPYASVSLMHTVLDVIKKLFPVRSCNLNLTDENIKAGKFKVCLDYHINLCKGPCEGLQSKEDYDNNISNIRKILNGNTRVVIRHLKQQMEEASKNLDFEKAQDLKDKIDKLEQFQAKSTVVSTRIHNVDVFSIYSNEKFAFVNYLRVVNGAIVQTYSVEFKKKMGERDEDILPMAIAYIKDRFQSKSREIIVPFDIYIEPPEGEKPFYFTCPQRGDKKKLLELSYKNVNHFARTRLRELSEREKKKSPVIQEARKDLNLPEVPSHIECIDNSHTQGDQPVSSVVVFKDGKPSKKDYRLFNLKSVDKPDDFAGMEEVVYRRFRRLLEEEEELPQLLLIDGGKGQLNAALKSLEKLDIRDRVTVRSIAKKLEEIYQPNDSYPLHLDKRSNTLKLLQHLRNEAHRFAVTHHKKKRMKSGLTTELTEAPGIGPKTAQQLLKKFKSVEKIKNAGYEAIANEIGSEKAGKLFNYLSPNESQANKRN